MQFKSHKITLVFFILVGFLLFSRLFNLGDKPYHHDESLYASTSWGYAQNGTYKFDPMLHGPLLFTLQAGLFKILPDNDFTGRLPSAMFGIIFCIFGFLLFYPDSVQRAMFFLIFAVFSPILSFYSRFLGFDLLMAGLYMLILFTAFEYQKTQKNFWILLSASFLALLLCTKLSFLFYLFPFVSFPFLYALFNPQSKIKSLILTGFHWAKANCLLVSKILLLMVTLYCALYSSFGTNPGGILDGLYRKMFPYWIQQNRIQRIKGPFHYYIPLLLIYELPLVLTFLFFTFKSLRRLSSKNIMILFSFCLMGLFAGFISSSKWPLVENFFDHVLHMDSPWHISIFISVLSVWIFTLKLHAQKKERWLFYLAHHCFFSFLIYAYAGEKIPWLTSHLVVAILLYTTALFSPLSNPFLVSPYKKWATFITVILILSWQTVILLRSSFLMSADPRERLVYTHTSHETLDVVKQIRHFSNITGQGVTLPVVVMGESDPIWPFAWYLRHYKNWFAFDKKIPPNAAVVIGNAWDKDKYKESLQGAYQLSTVKLREWWVPTREGTLKDFLKYYFLRTPHNDPGFSQMAVFIRSDLPSK